MPKKRANGFYQRSITTGRGSDGKITRKIIYAKTIKALDAKAAEYSRLLKHGMLSTDEYVTFGELAEIWLKDYKPTIAPTTRSMYQRAAHKHLEALWSVPAKELKPYHLQAVINGMVQEGYARSTIHKAKITAAQVIDMAVKNDILYRNVFLSVEVPPAPKAEQRMLTEEIGRASCRERV